MNVIKTLLDINKKYLLDLNGKQFRLSYFEPKNGPIGEGGSSIVYKAREEGKQEDFVVIKEFFPHSLDVQRNKDGSIYVADEKKDKDEYERRYQQALNEPEKVSKLRHDDKTETNDPWFLSYSKPIEIKEKNTLYTIIATEKGKMLSDMIKSGFFIDDKIEFIYICNCILMILKTLKQVHKKFLHLDISPDNILFSNLMEDKFSPGVARIIDYNSAFEINSDSRDWMPSYKPGYSASELYPNDYSLTKPPTLSPATDLYSVAAIFFELLINRAPKEGDWSRRSRWLLNNKARYFTGESNVLVDKTNAFLIKGLEPLSSERFKDVDEMEEAIDKLINLAQKLKTLREKAIENSKSKFTTWEKEYNKFYNLLHGDNKSGYIRMEFKDEDNNEYNIDNLLPKIKEKECPHAILTGDGGMGKTTTCMLLLDMYFKEEKLAVYIPLHHYEPRPEKNADPNKKYNTLKNSIMEAFNINNCEDYDLAIEENIILLLDGLNEIKPDYKSLDRINELDKHKKIKRYYKRAFFEELNELTSKKNIQVLITSREQSDFLGHFSSFTKLTFEPINKDFINEWLKNDSLKNKNELLPSGLYNVLGNPMLLKMYSLYNSLKKEKLHDNLEGLGFLITPITAGEIIWNFIEYQALETDGYYKTNKDEAGLGTIIFRLLLPFIAYQVETNKEENIVFTKKELECYIDNFEKHFDVNSNEILLKFEYFSGETKESDLLKRTLKIFYAKESEVADDLIKLCAENICIIRELENNTYEFSHQYFRDIFSATHIMNQMKLKDKSVFTTRTLPVYIYKMLSDILQEHKYIPKVNMED